MSHARKGRCELCGILCMSHAREDVSCVGCVSNGAFDGLLG